jgi:hypothetical protein
VEVQGFRWGKGDSVIAGDYTYGYAKGNKNHRLETGFFVAQRIV